MGGHFRRIDAVRQAARRAGIDGFVSTHLPDIRYLTGYRGSHAAVAVNARTIVLVTDSRYQDSARDEAPHCEVVIDRNVVGAAVAALVENGCNTVGYDPRTIFADDWATLTNVAAAAATAVTTTAVPGLIPQIRSVKDDDEVAAIAEACSVSVRALQELLRQPVAGHSEAFVARTLELAMAAEGGEDRAFPTIVAAGPHSAIPHHRPGQALIQPGDLLKIDWGALVDGYHADCTRTFVVGMPPQQWQDELHGLVDEAARRARERVAPGVTIAEVDAAARAFLSEEGQADAFIHGLGHGVGLEIHEAPMLSSASTGTLAEGQVITIEPGVYWPGRGGVRIEDTVVVTDTGHEVLTEFPRDLRTID